MVNCDDSNFNKSCSREPKPAFAKCKLYLENGAKYFAAKVK